MAGFIRLAMFLLGKVFFLEFVVTTFRAKRRLMRDLRARANEAEQRLPERPRDPVVAPTPEWDGLIDLPSGRWNWYLVEGGWGEKTVVFTDATEPRNQIYAHAGDDFDASDDALASAAGNAYRRTWVQSGTTWCLDIEAADVVKVFEAPSVRRAAALPACFWFRPVFTDEGTAEFPWCDVGLVSNKRLVEWFNESCQAAGHGV